MKLSVYSLPGSISIVKEKSYFNMLKSLYIIFFGPDLLEMLK